MCQFRVVFVSGSAFWLDLCLPVLKIGRQMVSRKVRVPLRTGSSRSSTTSLAVPAAVLDVPPRLDRPSRLEPVGNPRRNDTPRKRFRPSHRE